MGVSGGCRGGLVVLLRLWSHVPHLVLAPPYAACLLLLHVRCWCWGCCERSKATVVAGCLLLLVLLLLLLVLLLLVLLLVLHLLWLVILRLLLLLLLLCLCWLVVLLSRGSEFKRCKVFHNLLGRTLESNCAVAAFVLLLLLYVEAEARWGW